MKPRNVVGEIRERSRRVRGAVHFYWVAFAGGDRDAFGQGLKEESPGLPLCPIVLRSSGFTDPNAVAADLLTVIESARSELEHPDFAERMRSASRVEIVLIARRELELESTSSPIVLPSWFPMLPSTSVTATITDLTWSTHVSLSADELHAGEIASLLYELDRELVHNLRASHQDDHQRVNALHDALGRSESRSFTDLLSSADMALSRIRNPRDFRPSRRGPTVVGYLWNLASKTSADQLPRQARRLGTALALSHEDLREARMSLVTVLGRPTERLEDPVMRWSFDLIVTSAAACQLLTAAHHADDYDWYPVPLLRSLSLDIRTSLDAVVRVLGAP